MDMTDQDYGKLVNEKSKPSPMWKNMLWAFVVGGLICCIGQGFQEWYQSMGLSKTDAGTAVTITLVLLSALLTGLDLYEKLAKHAGAGTLGAGDRVCKLGGGAGHGVQERGVVTGRRRRCSHSPGRSLCSALVPALSMASSCS